MKKAIYLKLFIFLPLFLFIPQIAAAEECLYNFAAKNPAGEFIPSVKFEIYEHARDVVGRSKPGKLIASGATDKILGKAVLKFDCKKRPENGIFAIKVKTLNNETANFWYYYRPDREINADDDPKINYLILSGLRIVFRDGENNLKKNVSFNLYTQKYDVDNNPIKEKKDLLGKFDTGESGGITIYVPQGSVRSIDRKISDNYVLEVSSIKKVKFIKYDLAVQEGSLTEKDYVLSSLKIILRDGQDNIYPEKTKIEIYRQAEDIDQNNNLGTKVGETSVNDQGEALFEYPAGLYAAVVKDSLGKQSIFWNLLIEEESLNERVLKMNQTRITILDASGQTMAPGTKFKIYELKEAPSGAYYQGKSIYSGSLDTNGFTNLSLRPGAYLAAYSHKPKGEKTSVVYGLAFKAVNNSTQTVKLKVSSAQAIEAGQSFRIGRSISQSEGLASRLSGQILLQVEKNGEAWYINPADFKKYYLANGTEAYKVMRFLGVGIKNSDLAKIPVGLQTGSSQFDSDGDGLGDKLEEALRTNPYAKNSDGDAYDDATELRAGFNPLGAGVASLNTSFANQQKGKILLQVESRGEAWYVDPADGKRYYLADGSAAYQIMRYLSLGATNSNIDQIEIGVLDSYRL